MYFEHFRTMAPAPMCAWYNGVENAVHITFLSWECPDGYDEVLCDNWSTRKVPSRDFEKFSAFLDCATKNREGFHTFGFPDGDGYLLAARGGDRLEFRTGPNVMPSLPSGSVIASMSGGDRDVINLLKVLVSAAQPSTYRNVTIPTGLTEVELRYWKSGVDSALGKRGDQLPDWGLDRLND